MSTRFNHRHAPAVLAFTALGLGAAFLPLQVGCSSNPDSYEKPAPAISAFTPGTYNPTTRVFTPNATLSVPQGGTAWFRANFGVTKGTAIVTPGNIAVETNVPFSIPNITTTTTYTLTVTGGDGATATATATVTVIAAPSGLTYANEDATYYRDVQIAPNTPTVSGSTPITYSIDPALPSGLALNTSTGAITGTPQVIHAPTVHTVTAQNSVGSTTRPITIRVAATPLSFSASPATISLGGTTILSWDASTVPGLFSAVTITASPADASLTGPFGLSGTKNVSPATSTTYTLSATPATGGPAVTRTAGVTVGTAPVAFTTYSATPSPTLYGGTSTLTWAYTGIPDTLTLNGENVLGSLSATVSPIRRQTFTLAGMNTLGGQSLDLKVAAKGLHHVAGSFSSGRGNVDGGVDAATGASNARFYRPNAIVWDEKANDGTMIVADYSNSLLRRITPDRTVTTIAGTPGVAGAAGTHADLTTLYQPRNAAVDPVTGDIYVGGEGYTTKRLLKLTPNGDGTYTPSAVPGFALNTNAMVIDSNRVMHFVEFNSGSGNYYTMDLTAGTPTPTLVANLFASGVSSATAMAKDFNGGRKLLYVVCTHKVMKIDISGATPVATLFAGTGTTGFLDHLTATSGQLAAPQGVSVDTSGNVYIADRDNFAVRMVPAGGTMPGALLTIAGQTGTKAEGYASSSTTVDATLPTSTTPCLSNTYYVLAQGNGTAGTKIFVADAGASFDNQSIRTITVSGTTSGGFPGGGTVYTLDDPAKPGIAFAGSPRLVGSNDGTGTGARFTFGTGSGANLATLPNGSLTFAADTTNNRVRVITAAGAVTTLQDSTATPVVFSSPRSVAVQFNPSTKALVALFVGDTGTTKKLRKFTPNGDGTFTEASFTVTGGTYPAAPNHQGLAVDSTAGYVYATDYTAAKVFKINADTGASTDLVAATGTGPIGAALDGDGALWVAIAGGHQVKKYDTTSGNLLLTVGTGVSGWVDGPAASAQMIAPTGIAAAGSYVFVTNYASSQTSTQNGIRMITAATGEVTSLLGYATSTTAPTFFGLRPGYLTPDNSGSTTARSQAGAVLYAPQGLAANQDGDLMVSTPHAVYQVVAPAGN